MYPSASVFRVTKTGEIPPVGATPDRAEYFLI
jgi:hypothetical protein